MEGAIVEQLRYCTSINLHPTLIHAPLIYDEHGGKILAELYKKYIEIALNAKLPFIMCSPTWRTNFERVIHSGINKNINVDAVTFMQNIKEEYPDAKNMIKIGGMIGCKGDAYQPNEGLSCLQAQDFHFWQINELIKAKPDFIIAETLPCLEEAKGMALSLEQTDIPYIISFVINKKACLLDNTPLMEAMDNIDAITKKNPIGYMVNCSFPSFLRAEHQEKRLFNRLIGFLANASSLDHCVLNLSSSIQSESVIDWANAMVELNEKFNIKILGGCCGTKHEHLQHIVKKNFLK